MSEKKGRKKIEREPDPVRDREAAWPCSNFVGLIKTAMEEENISCTQLARKIGKTPAHVYQILNKPGNHNVHTMFDLAWGLGRRLHIAVYPHDGAAVPAPAACVADLWKGELEVNAENAPEYLAVALKRLSSVQDVDIQRGEKTVSLEITMLDKDDYKNIVPQYYQLFSSMSYVCNLVGKNIGLKINLIAAEEDEEEVLDAVEEASEETE
jgi:hypothetical protein